MVDKKTFLETVGNYIRSNDAKKIVAKELEQHIQTNIEHYLNEGFTEEMAEQKAVNQMGSPYTIGEKFNKIYKPRIDWGLVLLFLLVLGIGTLPLIILKDTTLSLNWTSKAFGIILGILIVLGLVLVNYKSWERKGWHFFSFGTLILLVAIYAHHYSAFSLFLPIINGRPYFKIGPFLTDTSIVLPIYLVGWAAIFLNHKIKIWLIGSLFALTLLLMLNTSNLPIVGIFVLMVFMMYWFSDRSHKLKTTLTVAIAGGVAIFLIWPSIFMYQKIRLMKFLSPNKSFIENNANEILKATGWGFQSIPKEGLPIPESHTDLVFLTLTYALGWGFSLFLLAILAVIIIKISFMTLKIKDSFGRLLIIGGITIFSVQIIYNIGMIFGLVPIVGISLPFISYGTVPIIINSIVIGIALSIHRRKNLIV
jgi:cell division protein FtsW (lipid II flippase)